jgi:hypothetical protein
MLSEFQVNVEVGIGRTFVPFLSVFPESAFGNGNRVYE